MYRQIVHFLQGQVLVRIECGCPERMLNLCGARGIPFWELTWESPVCLTLRAVGRDLPRLRQAAEDAGGSLHLCRSGGVPVFWRRLRRRYVLLAGAVLALVLMFGGNLVIWDFQVSGNDTVPTETILRALEDYGITVCPIVTVREIISFLHNRPVDGKVYIDDDMKARMEAYLAEYGAKA